MKSKKLLALALMMLIALIVIGCSSTTDNKNSSSGSTNEGNSNTSSGLPEEMTWSVYDVGSGGYAEMSAIANTFTEQLGMQVRMLPSASGVGRMVPLRDGTASIGKVGDEIQFAFEAMEEFAQKDWGPQDVRAIWAPVSLYGFAVREDSDIESIEDLKGKKVPRIAGNSSVNIKNEAMLAFAGLTWDDVEVVELTSYSGQGDALIQGQIDVAGINPVASTMFEADSKGGIRWLEMDPNDSESWGDLQEVASWFFSETSDIGAGMDEDTDVMGHGYLIAGYENQDPEVIYELLNVMNDHFDNYKDATSSLSSYSIDEVLTDPRGIPFHEGAIKFFEENGLWDEEKQAKNDRLVERYDVLMEAWEQVVKEAEEQGISDDDFPEFWMERKAELVD
ncbi:TAXI family TRAP transporter solute-binding subunit [Oceanobacillus senegalensis]|uniref:TAXI family TRAP transporter solute-binding subunit n=1 Tax=Oceanobacillus senegalensis TaxID=1936063 RepID=UPI000A30987D|nr:TAXI family TRAP transporter solute-binding subunit [Oceanobacillus senegalensis]